MGFFGFSERTTTLPWTQVTSPEELDNILASDPERPKLFFKHSTRCSISAMVLRSFESEFTSDKCDLYFIDLLRHRDVSNAIADRTQVRHESPQVIVVKEGEVIYQASHSSVDARKIEKILDTL